MAALYPIDSTKSQGISTRCRGALYRTRRHRHGRNGNQVNPAAHAPKASQLNKIDLSENCIARPRRCMPSLKDFQDGRSPPDSPPGGSDRQGNSDCRAAARAGFDFDFAAVRFDDAGHNGQTQTRSFGFGGVEQRSKRPLALLLRHPVAGVSELNVDVSWFFSVVERSLGTR